MMRWHGDLASGLVAIGELDEAEATIHGARAAIAHRTHNAGVTAQLDRAEALLQTERGDVDGAVDAARRSAIRRFELLGQPIEQGHTLLVLGQVERRRRRYAAARAAVTEALSIFTRVGAKPWVEQATRTLSRVDGTGDVPAAAARGQPGTAGRADRHRGAHRRDGARGREQPGDRDPDVPQREDGRGHADPDLPQARRPLPHPAQLQARLRSTFD